MSMRAGCKSCALASQNPLVFDDYFELDHSETVSPFITKNSRHWAANLTLKSSILAALLLLISFICSFYAEAKPISNVLLTLVYFIVGIPALIEAIEELAAFEINIDILMTLAAFSSVLIGSGMEGGLLLVLFALSGSMEDFVTAKAKGDISSLHKLSPTKACVVESNGTILERSIKDISVGTNILIKAGQVVPLDGQVIDGISTLNLVHLTGENLPVRKSVGDEVPAGARNLEGALTLKVTRTSANSTIAKIIQMVIQAQEERPILQRWFDKLSKGYAIAIILLAAFFALSLPFILNIPFFGVEGSVYRALAFLIAASPCALIIAIPIAYLSAVGVCARQGILLKGGITLDALANCSILAFDKTGTLTTGNLALQGIESISPTSQAELDEAYAIALALEKNAVHPIAKAITAYGQEHKLPIIPTKDFKSVPGYGLTATCKTISGEMPVYIGHPKYILNNIDAKNHDLLEQKMIQPKEDGEIVAVLSVGKNIFILRFQDTIRPDIKETIATLKKKQNMQLVMLTGDHEKSARHIAEEVGITDYRANLKPEDKLKYVTQMAEKYGLAMVGDGINDAPALARATVGICMGKVGSTPAIDAADVVLLNDNIEKINWLIEKAKKTQRIVKQNLVLATLAIIIASLPALAGMVPLWLAVVMHEGGTVLVGLNGLRLLRY
jgi:Cd2+/Zn2+-exporting ATPase